MEVRLQVMLHHPEMQLMVTPQTWVSQTRYVLKGSLCGRPNRETCRYRRIRAICIRH